jgi:hypothetical protein
VTRLIRFAGLPLLFLLGACGPGAAPSPTPADLTAVLEALALRGATLRQAVSGDAGCPAAELHSNAVRFDLSLEASDTRYQVYLLRWRRPADFSAAADAFEACLDDYTSRGVAADIQFLELPPWRAYGSGWSEDLREVLEQSLRAAGGS